MKARQGHVNTAEQEQQMLMCKTLVERLEHVGVVKLINVH